MSYAEGYRNGHLDRFLGVRSIYAEAPEHGEYASGYHDGVLGLPANDPASNRQAKVLGAFDR